MEADYNTTDKAVKNKFLIIRNTDCICGHERTRNDTLIFEEHVNLNIF